MRWWMRLSCHVSDSISNVVSISVASSSSLDSIANKDSVKKKHKMLKMRKRALSNFLILLLILFRGSTCPSVETKSCKPSGRKRTETTSEKKCKCENQSECCKDDAFFRTFKGSPHVSHRTKATANINSFKKVGMRVRGLNTTRSSTQTTGWFNNRSRCSKNTTINGNRRKVNAMLMDKCDPTTGCDSSHNYQPPCADHIVDASKAFREALGVPTHVDALDIHWSDA